ncbi:LOW QUALITY PROTEIN: ovostatin-like [Colius striatus]|uniref:LOW QUALITY PROTEIN: ovostatin-like n=1 Tax=Colius striatus TaxID=57412 RepID=UPI002B1E5EF9|nr:LOW QUALITY PROTEIN: ovostatin-like [Colius striatus]
MRKMWMKFLFALLLLHVTAAKEPELQYVLMVPAVLQTESPSRVCLQLLNLNETISVRVILEYGAVNTTIFEQTMTTSNGLQCFNFMIPPVNSALLAFISFSAKGITVSLEERRLVMIWNRESIVFVQTDKPIYKPGQSVMFHVVTLDFNFKPVQETYPLIAIQLDIEGCLSQVFSSNIFELNCTGYMRNLDVKAIVTEKGTGLQLTVTRSISITWVMSSIQFENVDRHYKRGIPYFGQMKLLDNDYSPISNEVIQLFINNKNTTSPLMRTATYKTNEECYSESWIEPSYPEAFLSIQSFYSWTDSFVRIEPLWKDLSCGQKRMITVNYVLDTEGYKSINIMNFYYVTSNKDSSRSSSSGSSKHALRLMFKLLKPSQFTCPVNGMARGKIILTGETEVNIQADKNGTFTIPLVVNEKMAPVLRLLVYTLHPAKELVADSIRFPVEKCFKNKVQLQFSKKQMHSASNVSLVIEAAANYFCAVKAVDQSVLLLKSEVELSAEKNVHQLLQMLFGCGEQNMVLFTPNIYVLYYLNITGQLSEEVKSKAIGYLVSGYQKQLSYKCPDGSYSIFGIIDKEGNTWLTAFVYKSFAQASHFIYIDDYVQAQTLMWLASKQKPDGCFRNVGTLFNNALKGGVDDELSLSAYITIAMLEAGHSTWYPVVRNAFFCLEFAYEKSISDVYTQALMAYAFCLAGKVEKCESFLRELQKLAKEDGEFYPFGKFGKQEEGTDLTVGTWSNFDNIESITT